MIQILDVHIKPTSLIITAALLRTIITISVVSGRLKEEIKMGRGGRRIRSQKQDSEYLRGISLIGIIVCIFIVVFILRFLLLLLPT